MQHHFDIDHAKKYGVEEAIVINCFQFWITHNRANGKHQHEGRTWTFNSVKALSEIFDYWTPKQIRRIMDSLQRQNVLITGNYNKLNYDRTTWYAFEDESLFLNGQPDLPKRANGLDQTGNSISPNGPTIPVNNPVNNPVNTHTQSEKSENELPTDYQPAYTHLITYLKANSHLIDGLKSRSGFTGPVVPILQDYLCKMQERGEWFKLRVPTDPDTHYRWVGEILGGVEGWAKVRKNNPRRKPAPGETVYEAPKNVYKLIRR